MLWNTLTDGPGNYFSAFLFFYSFAMFYWEPPPSLTKHAQWFRLFSLVSYYFNSFSFATNVWILQCRDISNTGKLNCILTLVFFFFFASLCLIVTQVALFILKRHAYVEILRTKLNIIKYDKLRNVSGSKYVHGNIILPYFYARSRYIIFSSCFKKSLWTS